MALNLKRALSRPFRLFLLGSTALALSLVAAGGTANAAPALPTCGEATVLVNDAQAAVNKAQTAFDVAKDNADGATSDLSALQNELAAIQAKLALAPPLNTLTALETLRLPALPGLINGAQSDNIAAQSALATATTNLTAAKVALASAIDTKKAACANVTVVTTTVAPPPVVTTLKAPIPTVVVDKIVVQNSQFRTIPNVARGVATG